MKDTAKTRQLFSGVALIAAFALWTALVQLVDVQPIDWSRAFLATGVALSVVCVAIFIATRQPYTGIFSFAMLVAKSLLVFGRTGKA